MYAFGYCFIDCARSGYWVLVVAQTSLTRCLTVDIWLNILYPSTYMSSTETRLLSTSKIVLQEAILLSDCSSQRHRSPKPTAPGEEIGFCVRGKFSDPTSAEMPTCVRIAGVGRRAFEANSPPRHGTGTNDSGAACISDHRSRHVNHGSLFLRHCSIGV